MNIPTVRLVFIGNIIIFSNNGRIAPTRNNVGLKNAPVAVNAIKATMPEYETMKSTNARAPRDARPAS